MHLMTSICVRLHSHSINFPVTHANLPKRTTATTTAIITENPGCACQGVVRGLTMRVMTQLQCYIFVRSLSHDTSRSHSHNYGESSIRSVSATVLCVCIDHARNDTTTRFVMVEVCDDWCTCKSSCYTKDNTWRKKCTWCMCGACSECSPGE